MPIGSITRGTTGTNRLRRIDRYIAVHPAFLRTQSPLVVDLGFGASATTVLELQQRLARVRPHTEVVGIEIDPARVAVARAALNRLPQRPSVSFAIGGFEVPLPGKRRTTVIRALNVLRQYEESAVVDHWRRMVARLEPGGRLIEGTCNELGRVACWVDVAASGPLSLTISLRLTDLDQPSIVAERLPKILIHRNIPGEKIHLLLRDLDRQWQVAAPLSSYGPSQRFIQAVRGLRAEGWPVIGTAARWRLGEVTVSWAAVAPHDFDW
ncbi:MAG: class I SAM-dependent methyltransferase [Microbacteriaceae bacterium]|nr:class I SAM-dependent methyltransferase [Microbacteriaceae bacterium]